MPRHLHPPTKMAGAVLVRSFEAFCRFLEEGFEDYVVSFTLPSGKVVKENAPFDGEDPMSYALVKMLFRESEVQIHVKPKR